MAEEVKPDVPAEAPVDAPAEPVVEVSEVPAADAREVMDLSGVPDGVVEKEDESVPEPVRDRIEHSEVVVHEYDDKGNVVGWHKEAVKGK